VPNPSATWKLVDFAERLDIWIELEQPPTEVVSEVAAWALTRSEDPYRNATREGAEFGHENLWQAKVPASLYDGKVVVCSYLIVEREHEVYCNLFGSLTSY
jgi:hypothetical protein